MNETTRVEELLADPKMDPKSRRYCQACLDGEAQAEIYLEKLRLNRDLIGMPLMGSYIRKIRDYPKNNRTKGLLVGFFSRLEQELGRWQLVELKEALERFTPDQRQAIFHEVARLNDAEVADE